tara:strand:- start:3548 stop:4315 length:768 start_codon:yes stop_codon:yes gene_type:complete
MAKEEQQQVEQQDPIVDSVVEETISLEEPAVEEGVEASEAVDWEQEAKKFQSMYDKKTAEHENLTRESQDLLQLKDTLNSRPELVNVIEKSLAGESIEDKAKEKSTTPDSFDPWDAYYKPDSESYKFRVSQEKQLVHETVDNELAKLQNQMAMNNLKTELVSEHNLGKEDAERFLQFATTPKANLPIETLIKVWKENEGKGVKVSENMEAVKKTKSIPKPAGVVQGGQQPQKSEADQVWDRVMSAGTRGRLTKQS